MSKSCQLAELLREIFTANANCSYFMSFAYSYLHHTLDKNSHVEALYGKTKSRKKSFGKENEKIGLKKNERDKKKKRFAMRCFPGKTLQVSIVIDTWRSVFSLVCGFIRRDNLRVWRKLFTNLYKLKSCIWFLAKYIHFERIYRVCRFDGLSWNFARTLQR